MTIEYLAGSRIQGLSSDTKPNNVQDFSTWEEVDTEKIYTFYKDTPAWKKLGSPSVGGWKELGRTTLGGANDTIDVTGLANKRYLMILSDLRASGDLNSAYRFNSDSGNNYAYRLCNNGGADSTAGSQNVMALNPLVDATPRFGVGYVANYSTKEKLLISHCVQQNTAGSGTAPARQESVNKHAQTINPISSVQLVNIDTGDHAIGSEVVVLGWDPLDTHTTNFWEELASVNASGSSQNLSSGTFTAKKYLWVQVFNGGVSGDINLTVNNNTTGIYARRYSVNGGADATNVSQTSISNMVSGGNTTPSFTNIFIINNSANEKLLIAHDVARSTSGATTAPVRLEMVGKVALTGSQITEIDLDSVTGNFPSSSIIKVWGSN